MNIFNNLDLLSVGIAIAATCVLGSTIFFNNRKSITNVTFLLFSLVTSLWGLLNYFTYHTSDPSFVLWLLRAVLFFALWQAFLIFQLFYVFPEVKFIFSKKYKLILLPLVALVSFLTLTPFIFSGISLYSSVGQVSEAKINAGIIAFGLLAVSLVISSIAILIRKLRSVESGQKRPYFQMLSGLIITFLLIIAFNFIIPVAMNDRSYIPLGALFILPFVFMTSYAILRHKLFNIKVTATAVLIFILSVVTFAEIIFSTTLPLVIFRSSVFVLVLIFGINLIRGVFREVEQREQIQAQATQLESFIHFLSHEVKGILGKNRDAYLSLEDGDFGDLPLEAKPFISLIYKDTNDAIDMVMNILHSADFKSGKMAMDMKPFDLKEEVKIICENMRKEAEEKGLSLTLYIDGDDAYTVVGDKENLSKHVIRNLIDNSIKYTPSGSISIRLEKKDGKTLISIRDTGVGVTPEDMKQLFTEGGRGKDSVKVNVHSTGFGLFFSKNIVDAHHGRVWAESEGAGKGSTFFIELPMAK
jgi:signal transduction histidine kinase